MQHHGVVDWYPDRELNVRDGIETRIDGPSIGRNVRSMSRYRKNGGLDIEVGSICELLQQCLRKVRDEPCAPC